MFAFFNARGADFNSFTIKKSCPLQVWIFSFLFCWIIFTAKKISFARHYCSFFTNWTFLCHKIYVNIKISYMQEINFIFVIAVLIMSVVIHEVSHGYTANILGDPTAKYAGRLTLNPLKHLDFMGSLVVPAVTFLIGGFIFGWAKPVPYNPYNLKNQRWGPAIVSMAGPLSNLTVALIFGLLIRFSSSIVFLPASFFQIAIWVVFINIILAIFNLIPIPPLDGSKVLFALFSYKLHHVQVFLEKYGFFLLLIFIFFFFRLLLPIAFGLFKFITGIGF